MGKLRSELSRVPFLQIVLGFRFSVAVVHRSLEEEFVTTGVTDANVTYPLVHEDERGSDGDKNT